MNKTTVSFMLEKPVFELIRGFSRDKQMKVAEIFRLLIMNGVFHVMSSSSDNIIKPLCEDIKDFYDIFYSYNGLSENQRVAMQSFRDDFEVYEEHERQQEEALEEYERQQERAAELAEREHEREQERAEYYATRYGRRSASSKKA